MEKRESIAYKSKVCPGCVIKQLRDGMEISFWTRREYENGKKYHSCQQCHRELYVKEAARRSEKDHSNPISPTSYWLEVIPDALELLEVERLRVRDLLDPYQKQAYENLLVELKESSTFIQDRGVFKERIRLRFRSLFEGNEEVMGLDQRKRECSAAIMLLKAQKRGLEKHSRQSHPKQQEAQVA